MYTKHEASGSSYEITTDTTTGNINATEYNRVDGYISGCLGSPEKTIGRISENFNTTDFYQNEIPSSDRDIDDAGADATKYYKIGLEPNSVNFGQHQATESLSQNASIDDWAFNALDRNLYAIEKSTNILYRIDPS